jgi:predicted amidohydrolase
MGISEETVIKIAAAQSISRAGDVAWNVAHHLVLAAQAAELGAQLIVFPELSLIGYELDLARASVLPPGSPLLDPLRRLAVEARITIVAGAPLPHGDQLHIGAVAFQPDGGYSTYSKQHVHVSEEHVFTSGPGGALLSVGDSAVALAICRDASFPAHAEAAVQRGAQVYAAGAMIVPEDYQRKAGLLQGYAASHGLVVMLANYAGTTGGEVSAGRSAIWHQDKVVVSAPDASEMLLIAERRLDTWTGQCWT